jgi:5-methylcytosine-specific restriction endonuclease McrA
VTGITAQLRARKRRDRLNAYVRACRAVDQRDGDVCRVCYAFIKSGAHHHHIVPRSLGGTNTTDNLIRVCASCHRDIHAKKLLVVGNADATIQLQPVTRGQ